MADQKKHIVETYRSEHEAVEAIELMKRQGYKSEDISVISRYEGEVGAATEKMDAAANHPSENIDANDDELFVQAGLFANGGSTGIPGIGPSLAAGPIADAFKGDLNEDDHDLLVNTLADMGVPENEARQYENDIREGKYLILVEEIENL